MIMPATGLYQRKKREIDFDNKPKTCISLANRRLHLLNLAFNSVAPNQLAGQDGAEPRDFVRDSALRLCKGDPCGRPMQFYD
jgi:hypothetical protein